MNILLWIALIGVIVFLLGLAYSRYSTAATKQPASKTISPAASPATALPMPVAPVIKPVATPPVASKPLEAAVTEVKSGVGIVPHATDKPVEAQPAPVKAPAPVIRIVPAAEPVGPAHNKPNHPTNVITADVPAGKPTSTELAIESPAASVEPERLTKPRHDKADDLTQIPGIGKAIQIKLYSAGIYHYDQLIGLSKIQATWINKAIGFAGRYERENWSAQAKKLAAKSNTPTAETPKRAPKAAAKTTNKSAVVKTKAAVKPKAKTVKKPTTAL